jgi:hypothetical protein
MHTNYLILAEVRIGDLQREAARQRQARQAGKAIAPADSKSVPVRRPSSARRVQPARASAGAAGCD